MTNPLCKIQRSIYNKKPGVPQFIAWDCAGSTILGTDNKPYRSVFKNDYKWIPLKKYNTKDNKPTVAELRLNTTKVSAKCKSYKYAPGGWKKKLLSPPYDAQDCKGMVLSGNDGRLWKAVLKTNRDGMPYGYWEPLRRFKTVKKKVVKKTKTKKKLVKKTQKISPALVKNVNKLLRLIYKYPDDESVMIYDILAVIPKKYILNLKDVLDIKRGKTISIVEPQSYDKVTKLNNKNMMFEPKDKYGYFSYYGSVEPLDKYAHRINAESGSGSDLWIKVVPGLDTYLQKKYKQLAKTKKKVVKKTKKKAKDLRIGRPSPAVSATLYTVGTKKRGGDGNMWEVVENKNKVKRWKKCNC